MTTQGGFDSRTVARVVGISARQIQYWDELGLVKPSARPAAGRGSRRLYSFLDLVRLSVVRRLIEHGLPPRKIRRSLAALREVVPEVLDPLTALKLVTDGDRLFLVTADERKILDVMSKQFLFSLALGPLVQEIHGRVERLSRLRGPRERQAAPPRGES